LYVLPKKGEDRNPEDPANPVEKEREEQSRRKLGKQLAYPTSSKGGTS
jgi:hypothetical protein